MEIIWNCFRWQDSFELSWVDSLSPYVSCESFRIKQITLDKRIDQFIFEKDRKCIPRRKSSKSEKIVDDPIKNNIKRWIDICDKAWQKLYHEIVQDS